MVKDGGTAVRALTVNNVAKAVGLNAQTIRYYEREGLLPKPPRTPGGYRAFPPDSVERVRFIKRSQELGFSLRETRELLILRTHPATACPKMLKRAQAKLASIGEKIRELQRMKHELTRLAEACTGRQRAHVCPLLEALDRGGGKHNEPRDRSSIKKNRPIEPGRSGSGNSRGLALLSRPAHPAGPWGRRHLGQPIEDP